MQAYLCRFCLSSLRQESRDCVPELSMGYTEIRRFFAEKKILDGIAAAAVLGSPQREKLISYSQLADFLFDIMQAFLCRFLPI